MQRLLRLAFRARLVSLTFLQAPDEERATGAVYELLTHPPFQAVAAAHLRCLAGAPSSAAGSRSTLRHLPPGAFPRLERLQLYVPSGQQVLSLRNPAWAALERLRELSVAGRHYVALRVLPPRLRRLGVSAWHVLAEPALLVRCPQVG